ncbi:MAG: GTPase ObgE [Oscillospiraceae bacterium]|nr:GTPase ObgE [Oscillospiraceae bacterium]
MPAFIDTAKISVRAGNGGNGAVSFHREKYVAAGGPDGGDGGKGGNIVLQTDSHMSTLMDFRYKRKYTAENGADGSQRQRTGKDGADLVIRVPIGTVVRDAETREVMKDMSDEEPFILAKGGKGGWGNQHFATPTRQAPRFAKGGLMGESREVALELKLLADVGLVGFPNVGKSTLLSVVSKAQPKIANYHFTTLFPNLGVVYVEEGVSFVMADIPGIIEGASEGAGLGHDFLRHIDRCRLLIHVVDVSGSEGRNPVEDFIAINQELYQYSPELAQRPMIVVGNKVDIAENRDDIELLKGHAEALGLPFFELSAAAHQGVRELVFAAAQRLKTLPPVKVFEPDYVPRLPEVDLSEPLSVQQEDGLWLIEGPWLQRLMSNVNFGDYESRNWFDKKLRESGLFDRLEEMGIQDGDIVSMYNWEFQYQK